MDYREIQEAGFDGPQQDAIFVLSLSLCTYGKGLLKKLKIPLITYIEE